jgi:hypothetical protein
MNEEQIRQKLKEIESTRKSKQKDREQTEGTLKKLRTSKKLEQIHMKTIAGLVELAFTESQDTEDSLLALWEQTLNLELRLINIEKTIEQLKQTVDFAEQNR